MAVGKVELITLAGGRQLRSDAGRPSAVPALLAELKRVREKLPEAREWAAETAERDDPEPITPREIDVRQAAEDAERAVQQLLDRERELSDLIADADRADADRLAGLIARHPERFGLIRETAEREARKAADVVRGEVVAALNSKRRGV